MPVVRSQISTAGVEIAQLDEVYEGQAFKVFARFLDLNGDVLLRAGFPTAGAYDMRLYDVTQSQKVEVFADIYNPNTEIESALATAGWRQDPIGYSFVYGFAPLSTTFRPLAGRKYRMEFVFHGSATGDFPMVVLIEPRSLSSYA